MSDARRRAEEALARWDASVSRDPGGAGLAVALRDLLAAGPEAPPPPSDAVREAAVREAAEAVSQTYYEIAAEAIGEDKVKAEFSSRFEERLAKRRDAARGGE